MSIPTPMYWLALDGFRQAKGRFDELIRIGSSAYGVVLPAMEAVYWANALDDRLKRDDPTYQSLAGSGPELMLGLRCVRNRGTHQLPMTVRKLGGMGIPMTLPAALGPVTMHWLQLAELPPPDPKFVNLKADAAYQRRFAGQIVANTLLEVAQWFGEEQQRTGSRIAP